MNFGCLSSQNLQSRILYSCFYEVLRTVGVYLSNERIHAKKKIVFFRFHVYFRAADPGSRPPTARGLLTTCWARGDSRSWRRILVFTLTTRTARRGHAQGQPRGGGEAPRVGSHPCGLGQPLSQPAGIVSPSRPRGLRGTFQHRAAGPGPRDCAPLSPAGKCSSLYLD